MNKYKIIIEKQVEDDKIDNDFGMMPNTRHGNRIFSAEMDSDSAVEILNHLWELKTRKLDQKLNNK